MSLADLLQTISLLTVAVTIVLSAAQNRHVAAQTREVATQSTLAHSALAQTAHQTMVGQSSSFLTTLISSEPELLAWFLKSRGIPTGSTELNKRYILMYQRMDVHEDTYLAHLSGALPDDFWKGWQRVIELDAATPEFLAVWRVVNDSYAARFAAFINRTIAQGTVDGATRLGEAVSMPINLHQQVPEDVVEG